MMLAGLLCSNLRIIDGGLIINTIYYSEFKEIIDLRNQKSGNSQFLINDGFIIE